MEVMTSHEWYDGDVEHVIFEGSDDIRLIILNPANEGSFLISEADVIALGKEFGHIIYPKDWNEII